MKAKELCSWCPTGKEQPVKCCGMCGACYQWQLKWRKASTPHFIKFMFKLDRANSRMEHLNIAKRRKRKSA